MLDLRKHLTPAQLKKLEAGHELPIEEAKRAFAQLLPKEAQARLRAVRNETELDNLTELYFGTKPVTFQIKEIFRGTPPPNQQVWTGYGSGDCGYDFQIGETYLVYAREDPQNGRMITSICTRTTPAAEAAEDLAYIRNVQSGKAVTKVFGYVFSNSQELGGLLRYRGPPASPIAGATVELESTGGVLATSTDAQGAFTFQDVPENDYEITASAAGYSFPASRHSFHVARYACSMRYLPAQPAPK